MPRILRTAQSKLDYDEIWDYIAQDDPQAAASLLQLLDETLHLIASSPHIGRMRSELDPRLCSFPVGNYLIFYRPIDGGMELIRVLHGARDIQADFFKDV